MNIDCAIGKLKKIPPKEAHAVAAKLRFSGKVETLRALLPNSEYKNATELDEFLTRIEDDALRNTFTHSFLASDEGTVSFIHREWRQGQYSANGYCFTADNFEVHVRAFVQLAHDFQKALGLSDAEIGNFAAEAIKEENQQ